MARILARSGIVGTIDFGLNLNRHQDSAQPYRANGIRALTVQNAQRKESAFEYSLEGGGKLFHPLEQKLPNLSVRSLVVVEKGLNDSSLWKDWCEEYVFARTRKREDGSSYPVLTAGIVLPNGDAHAVTHLLQILTHSFADWSSRPVPKEMPEHGDEIHIEMKQNFTLYAGPSNGPLTRVAIEGVDEFESLELRSTVRPDEPADPFPPG